MHAASESAKRHWSREPWVWLLIALPLTAVIAGMVTLYLAIVSSDGLVVDDYYRRGKAINRDLARDQAAADHQLHAALDYTAAQNLFTLILQAQDYTLPQAVGLSVLHPTMAGRDQVVTLVHQGAGHYAGAAADLAPGNWYIQLEADDWRLSGSLPVPGTTPLVLLPAVTGS